MAKRKRRNLGEAWHSPAKVSRASTRSHKGKAFPVRVTVERGSTGLYYAFACANSRTTTRSGARTSKAKHCGTISGGASPTLAAARALASLAKTLGRGRV